MTSEEEEGRRLFREALSGLTKLPSASVAVEMAMRRVEGRAYGVVTVKALAVLEALLWAFHNARSGLCFPSYEKIAEAAHCARSTIAEALKMLEAAGILTWVHRVKRIRERCSDPLGDNGWRWRVLRTSNAYAFHDPSPAADRLKSSKSDFQYGTPNQVFRAID